MSRATDNIIFGPEEECNIPAESIGKYFLEKLKGRHAEDIVNIDAETKRALTVHELLEKSVNLTYGLKELSINKGDVIAILSENTTHYCIAVLAGLYMGVAVTTLNPGYKSDELRHAILLSRPKLVFCSGRILETMVALRNEEGLGFIQTILLMGLKNRNLPEILTLDELLETSNVHYLQYTPEEFDCSQQVAFICLSSGTTGLPKGVMLTHENLRTPLSYLSNPRYGNLTSRDTSIGILPFFHIFGLVLQIATVITESKLVIMDAFKPDVFLRLIQEHKVTKLYLVPPLLLFLIRSPDVRNYNISSLEDIVCGGAPLKKEQQEEIWQRLPKIKIRQVYGLTETSGGCAFQTDHSNAGSVGTLIPNILAKVRVLNSNQSAGPDTVGEICVKGSMVMKGYCGDLEATDAAIVEDGFYRTGDIGYYDKNGCFFIVDRIKELIKYKGFQVPPAELEALINTHPGVYESGVIGIPDERAVEVPLAYVVRTPNSNVTEQEIKDYVAERISNQKHLYGGVRFITEVPKNPSGKILRRRLVELYRQT